LAPFQRKGQSGGCWSTSTAQVFCEKVKAYVGCAVITTDEANQEMGNCVSMQMLAVHVHIY